MPAGGCWQSTAKWLHRAGKVSGSRAGRSGEGFPPQGITQQFALPNCILEKKKKKEKRIIYLEGLDEAWMLSRAGNRGKRCLCNPSALPPSAGLLNWDRLPRRCLLTPRSCISLLPRWRTAPPAHRRGRRKHKKKQKTHAGKVSGTVQLINCNH